MWNKYHLTETSRAVDLSVLPFQQFSAQRRVLEDARRARDDEAQQLQSYLLKGLSDETRSFCHVHPARSTLFRVTASLSLEGASKLRHISRHNCSNLRSSHERTEEPKLWYAYATYSETILGLRHLLRMIASQIFVRRTFPQLRSIHVCQRDTKLEGISPKTAEYTADSDDSWRAISMVFSTRSGQLDDNRARRETGTSLERTYRCMMMESNLGEV